jgi:hypothetical protein
VDKPHATGALAAGEQRIFICKIVHPAESAVSSLSIYFHTLFAFDW